MSSTIRPGLPPLPARMQGLPLDDKQYPVPYFVAWIDGKPDHRVADATKMPRAIRYGLCWMCGQKLGKFKSFCIGPMCSITRTISEPPSHLECLRFAVAACPFMTRPRAKRREGGLADDLVLPAGDGLRRNPGAVCIWTTRSFRPWIPPGSNSALFDLGDPEHTEWYAEGRPAMRAEVDESISTGLPSLYKPAQEQDIAEPESHAVEHLERRIAIETARLDRQAWPG